MRIILCFALIVLSVSCLDERDNYIKKSDIVRISEELIPDTSVNLNIIQIRAKAEESNGCWRDLYFVLDRKNNFEYNLLALGTYEGNGVCPDIMVYKDSIIDFLPDKKGIYYFHIVKSKEKITTDTIYVE